jgi:hypothetical protein
VLRSQEQTGGPDSTNFQAGRDIVHNGVTATEARNIALDVFNANFLRLVGVAEDVARDRAERITRDYLEKLQAENPNALNSVQEPDMLQAIYTAQKAYACSGEEELEKTLVDLLIDRSGQQDRELKTLVLNEAIAVLPKLSNCQRKSIAICFFVRYTRYTGPLNFGLYCAYLSQGLAPFADMLSGRRVDYQHIQSAGAGWISAFTFELGAVFSEVARGFFTKGFFADQVPDDLRQHLSNSDIFVPCLRDPDKLQVNSPSAQGIRDLACAKNVDPDKLDNLSGIGIMTTPDIQSELISNVPCMNVVFDRWNTADSLLQRLELTSVGMAIGHAYWRKVSGNSSVPLDIWL